MAWLSSSPTPTSPSPPPRSPSGVFTTLSGQAQRLEAGALIALGAIVLAGLTSVAPGEARVLQLFGGYAGTVRTPGLRWVNPLARRHPIEIAAVVVWQVADTARARFAADNVVHFVAVQTEAAVRHVATGFAYDAAVRGQLSLRDNATEITERLSAEIAQRIEPAGVKVLESRITRLAYAPEIAQAMLRRQQASAVVAARQQIVEGAVGMVQLALSRLEEEDIVELDAERKASMVSNLMVVLCSDHPTQPVVNVGSLYQ